MHLRDAARKVDGELLANLFGGFHKVWKRSEKLLDVAGVVGYVICCNGSN